MYYPNGNLLVTEDPGGSWTNYLELRVINHKQEIVTHFKST